MDLLNNEINENSTKRTVNLTTTGKILVGITGGVALGLTVICAPFVSPALRKFCLPYIPATNEQVKNVFTALKNRRGTLVDLGSGDGRIVIDAAKRGYVSTGVELNPWLVAFSKLNALKQGQGKQTSFYCKDLWKFNLQKYDNIVIFGVEQMMADLELKLLKECHKECNIVACRFPLPNLSPCNTVGAGIDSVWLYKIPLSNKS